MVRLVRRLDGREVAVSSRIVAVAFLVLVGLFAWQGYTYYDQGQQNARRINDIRALRAMGVKLTRQANLDLCEAVNRLVRVATKSDPAATRRLLRQLGISEARIDAVLGQLEKQAKRETKKLLIRCEKLPTQRLKPSPPG